MDLQRQYETFYKEALAFKTAGRLADAAAVEAKAAALLSQLERYVLEHPRDLQTADYLLFLAEREWPIWGDDPRVLAKLEQALRIREDLLGPEDPLVSDALTPLAEFHFLSGRWTQAEPYYRRAIAIYEKSSAPSSLLFAKCQGGLAQTLAALNHPREADPFFAAAIARLEGCEDEKRVMYFLLMQRADGLDILERRPEAAQLRRQAAALLPKNNPGELGFHV